MLFGTTEVIGAVWHIQKYTNNKNVDLNFNKIQGGVSKTENTYKYQEKHFDYYGKLLLPLDSGLAIFLKFFSERWDDLFQNSDIKITLLLSLAVIIGLKDISANMRLPSTQ